MPKSKGRTPYDHDRIRELKRIGLSNQQIAERFGCCERTVRRALKERP